MDFMWLCLVSVRCISVGLVGAFSMCWSVMHAPIVERDSFYGRVPIGFVSLFPSSCVRVLYGLYFRCVLSCEDRNRLSPNFVLV
jgi:hypothetical protein